LHDSFLGGVESASCIKRFMRLACFMVINILF